MKRPEVHIRRIRPGEGQLLKLIRLAALADQPEAFSETLEQARAVLDAEYEARARAGADGDDWVVLVATDGADAAGIVAGHDEGDRVALVSMWVAPAYRRRGVARALIDKLLEWAAAEVYLHVGDRNEAAKALYASMGFVPTGRSQGLAWKPEVREIEMVRRSEAPGVTVTSAFSILWRNVPPVAMTLENPPVVRTQMLIRRPIEDVFNAFVDPSVTTRFWFTKSSGRVEPGKTLRWDWEMYGVHADVSVKAVDENRRILIEWDDPPCPVEWLFTPRSDAETLVVITNSGFTGTGDEVVAQAIDSMGGFSFVLASLKALLEHGIALDLVADHHPDAVQPGWSERS